MNLFVTGRPVIMGILNVTPDSFSDGGDFFSRDAAVAHGLRMAAEGAGIIDVGGESTRPGAKRTAADEQIRRVVPVIETLRRQLSPDVFISVDTTSMAVARAACSAGAGMINDISAGEEEREMFKFAAERKILMILMHKQGTPESMQTHPVYENVVQDVRLYLLDRAGIAMRAGMLRQQLLLDPGFGFGKTQEHNLQLLSNLDQLTDAGFPVMIGTSRKAFLSRLGNEEDRKKLVGATCATTVMGVMAGVKLFRVHDVRENRQAADVAYATLQL